MWNIGVASLTNPKWPVQEVANQFHVYQAYFFLIVPNLGSNNPYLVGFPN